MRKMKKLVGSNFINPNKPKPVSEIFEMNDEKDVKIISINLGFDTRPIIFMQILLN